MNHTQQIINRLEENKSSIKTYATYESAVSTAEKMVTFTANYFQLPENHSKMGYIIVGLPSGRFTIIFQVMEFLNSNELGGYLGFLAEKGFYCI